MCLDTEHVRWWKDKNDVPTSVKYRLGHTELFPQGDVWRTREGRNRDIELSQKGSVTGKGGE